MANSSMSTKSDCDMEDDTEEGISGVFPGFASVNEYSQKTLGSVLMATRSSNDLPVGDDFDFYSTFRSVRDVLELEGQRILTLLQRLLRHQNLKGNIHREHSAELDDQFDILMDANDQILERVGILLDEASGLRKEETKLVIVSASTPNTKAPSSWNKPATTSGSKPEVAYRLMTARNIQRPQLRFRDKIDNSNLPFKPHLQHKPHALKSLEDSLRLPEGVSFEDTVRPEFNYPHPYAFELQAFVPNAESLQKVSPKAAHPINLTPLLYVDSIKDLTTMIEDLKTQAEIAVDLEHHSYRSFQGLTCLMQISTRSRDYIIDTLELRNEIYLLNDVFADPSITKVFHGADSDISWLQRDFSIYVVNMFDTGQAARTLGLSRFSLAHLMLNYCKIEIDKQYQLADWRIRPLPAELLNYAREDTHYLLYIYDVMRNQLIDKGNEQSNLLLSVFERSKTVASKVYQKACFKKDDYMELYHRSKKVFNNQQMTALRELYSWRDAMARVEDESFGYVLPNHMLLQIAEILPRERQGVLACCNPIPPLVRQNLIELHEIVLRAREVALTKIEKAPVLQPSAMQHPKYDIESLLSCPHDQTHTSEKRVPAEICSLDPDLLAHRSSMFSESADTPALVKRVPIITAFSTNVVQKSTKERVQKVIDSVKLSFRSHFFKFLPSEDIQSPVKPQRSEIWVLKPPTNLKRKADGTDSTVDVNTFQPEFIPPTKKAKPATMVNTTSSLFKVPEKTANQKPANLKQSTQSSGQTPGLIKQTPTVEDKIAKNIKSIRQEITAKKKKNKLKSKKHDKSQGTTEPQGLEGPESHAGDAMSPSIGDGGDEVSVSLSQTSGLLRNSLDSSSDASTPLSKKKKKKRKITLEDVETNFQAFDYAAAETKLLKQNKNQPRGHLFNPSLPQRTGKHKDKVKRPKLSGPKSNTSVSFPVSKGSNFKKM